MKGYIEERAVKTAEYIIETKATVRQTARKFGVSKSTVHKDVTARLTRINPALANEARKVLDVNKKERHIRDGWHPMLRPSVHHCKHFHNGDRKCIYPYYGR